MGCNEGWEGSRERERERGTKSPIGRTRCRIELGALLPPPVCSSAFKAKGSLERFLVSFFPLPTAKKDLGKGEGIEQPARIRSRNQTNFLAPFPPILLCVMRLERERGGKLHWAHLSLFRSTNPRVPAFKFVEMHAGAGRRRRLSDRERRRQRRNSRGGRATFPIGPSAPDTSG